MKIPLILALSTLVLAQSDNVTATDASCSLVSDGSYSLSFHISGIFIVLACSAAGSAISIALGTKAHKGWLYQLLQLVKFFGIGIIAATAWIHLLPDAFESFSSPCLDASWAQYGPAWVGVFGLVAAFAVQLLEMAGHTHSPSSRKASHDSDPTPDGAVPKRDAVAPLPDVECGTHIHVQDTSLAKRISTLVLECGVLVHSLIIGLTLGVALDDEFKTLLIAVSFHQFFEGLALGIMIAEHFTSTMVHVLLGTLYPLATPAGIAIGIALQKSYNETDSSILVLRGIFNSLSAGILIYNTYCGLVGGEINHNP
ncbi:high-affinity Zn(2+) transporter zrt1, partial [Kappamyces sp. JEL0680]